MGVDLSSLNPKARTLVERAMLGLDKPTSAPAPSIAGNIATSIEVAPSKVEDDLNKTERAFLEKLRSENHAWIGTQAVTLLLADHCRYTPDFVTVTDGALIAWEVKGFWRDDARVKIKVAARQFRFIRFVAVQRKGGAWTEEVIAP